MDIRNKLPYVRDRLIEGYFWILGIYFEPQHSRTRMFLMKTCMWLIVLDDTFDNYGTYEELKMFTQAVERYLVVHFTLGLKQILVHIYINYIHHLFSANCIL